MSKFSISATNVFAHQECEIVKTPSEEQISHDKSNSCDKSSETPLTKNQLKRNRKAEMWERKKIEMKNAKKMKKLERLPEIAATEVQQSLHTSDAAFDHVESPASKHTVVNDNTYKPSRREKARQRLSEQSLESFAVVIDCAFEDQHAEGPLKSLCQQISFCYGFNRKHSNPVEMYCTGIGPRTQSQMAKVKAENWIGIVFDNRCYTQISSFTSTNSTHVSTDDEESRPRVKELVYLTSDAEETLETLDNSCAYIIGGIVDRNSLKGTTRDKATAQGIRTAKLPIREHLKMTRTHVLTVNHVFEILLRYREHGNWKKALETVMPPRKGATVRDTPTEECQDNCGVVCGEGLDTTGCDQHSIDKSKSPEIHTSSA